MFQRIRDKNIWVVYAAILDLGIAYGISISLIAHHLDAHGFTKSQMGSLASSFALGIVAFSLPAGWLVRRVSAKSTLVACLFGYALCVSSFPFLADFRAVAIARFFDGAFSVGVWVSCETILLARAREGTKALVTSLYAMSIAVGYVVGPLVARVLVAHLPMWMAFAGAGVLALVALVLVASMLDHHAASTNATEGDGAPPDLAAPQTPMRALFWRIKTSCFATFAYGYFQASVVLFLPLFLMHEKHVEQGRTIIVPAFFAAGMLLFSNVAGRLGDRLGHLRVMRLLASVGLVMVLGFVFLDAYPVMCVAVFIAGATLASISPVSLALQGVVTDRPSLSRANAIYNVFYAAGMLLGPAASGQLFERWGGGVMLTHLAILWGLFVGFCFVFRQDDPAAQRELASSRAGGPHPVGA